MVEKIDASQLKKFESEFVLIDVRSPSEYTQGHIIGACNIPLFSDDERAIVGTTYKKVSPENALLQGLDFVGKKMSSFIKMARKTAPNRKIIVYCWRGGKRSGSFSWLLDMSGFDVKVINGGYKAYRSTMSDYIENSPFILRKVGGKTGTGKTEILQHIAKKGGQIIDLEGIAHHKGSAFGELGEEKQPTNEQFENNLFNAISNLDLSKEIWIENESRGIGKVFLPECFWKSFILADLYNVEIPNHLRIERLIQDYAKFPKELLIQKFETIEKKIGGQHKKAAVDAILVDDFGKAVEISLVWYDKTYSFGLEKKYFNQLFQLNFDHADMNKIAEQLLQL